MKNQNTSIIVILGIILVLAVTIFILNNNHIKETSVTDFESCVRAGYPIKESYPRQCGTPSGQNFVEQISERRHISEDPEVCLLIRFQCIEGTSYFSDETGCGCEGVFKDQLKYFQDQMWSQGVENLGGAMPIEGFSPDLYMGAFPNLEKSDFNGAAAYGGTWIYDNNELILEKDESQPITSAEGTVTQAGMQRLLDNLADRLNIKPDTKENIDLIIAEIE